MLPAATTYLLDVWNLSQYPLVVFEDLQVENNHMWATLYASDLYNLNSS